MSTLKLEMQEVNIQISQMSKSLEQMNEAFDTITDGLKGKYDKKPEHVVGSVVSSVASIFKSSKEGANRDEEVIVQVENES